MLTVIRQVADTSRYLRRLPVGELTAYAWVDLPKAEVFDNLNKAVSYVKKHDVQGVEYLSLTLIPVTEAELAEAGGLSALDQVIYSKGLTDEELDLIKSKWKGRNASR